VKATYKACMGDDNFVVDMARVSFAKEASNFAKEQNDKLLNYLATHGHWSPFAHPTVCFHIRAPQFVARQAAKHQIGFAWNEVSRRYVSDAPEFHNPRNWRAANPNKKQGSIEDQFVTELDVGADAPIDINLAYDKVKKLSEGVYKYMVSSGVAPEQARIVLPQSTYTEWYWTGSLYAWARAANLRLKPDAQLEIRELFQQIDAVMKGLFPVSWRALVHNDSK